eukprot:15443988-Alexandrium_andersonii.AAC.1
MPPATMMQHQRIRRKRCAVPNFIRNALVNDADWLEGSAVPSSVRRTNRYCATAAEQAPTPARAST